MSDDHIIKSANVILSQLTVPTRVQSIDELSSDLFVTLYEGLCGERLPDLIDNASCDEDRQHNIQCVIDSLSMDVLHTSLSHISAADIMKRKRSSLINLLDIFHGLLEYILDGIAKDTDESEADDQKHVRYEDTDDNTEELIALGRQTSPNSPSRKKRRSSRDKTKTVTPQVINQPMASSSMQSIDPGAESDISDGLSQKPVTGRGQRRPAHLPHSTKVLDQTFTKLVVPKTTSLPVRHDTDGPATSERHSMAPPASDYPSIAPPASETHPVTPITSQSRPLASNTSDPCLVPLHTPESRPLASATTERHSLTATGAERYPVAIVSERHPVSTTSNRHPAPTTTSERLPVGASDREKPRRRTELRSLRESITQRSGDKDRGICDESETMVRAVEPRTTKRHVSFYSDRTLDNKEKCSDRLSLSGRLSEFFNNKENVSEISKNQSNKAFTSTGWVNDAHTRSDSRTNGSGEGLSSGNFLLAATQRCPRTQQSKQPNEPKPPASPKRNAQTLTADTHTATRQTLKRLYEEELRRMKAERAQLISEERFETRKQDEFYKENLQKLSAAINQIPAPRRSPRLRNKPKGFLTEKRKVITKTTKKPAREATSKHETIADLMTLREDFPHLYLAPETVTKMWQEHQRQRDALKRAETRDRQRQRTVNTQLAEAEKKQLMVSHILQKERDQAERMREIKERRDCVIESRRRAREAKQKSARVNKYYDDYVIHTKSLLLRNKTNEEQLFRRLFSEGLKVQRERMREARKVTREARQAQSLQQLAQVQALENFYKDQFAMLSENMAERSKNAQIRDNAQATIISKMKRELRKKMEDDIAGFQEQLRNDDEDFYHRQLDAERALRQLTVTRLQAGV